MKKHEIPLWKQIRDKQDLYGSLWPNKLAYILEQIADMVEYRGQIDYDRDPGETSDWLRREAKLALEAAE